MGQLEIVISHIEDQVFKALKERGTDPLQIDAIASHLTHMIKGHLEKQGYLITDYTIEAKNVSDMSVEEKAQRKLPPFTVTLNRIPVVPYDGPDVDGDPDFWEQFYERHHRAQG